MTGQRTSQVIANNPGATKQWPFWKVWPGVNFRCQQRFRACLAKNCFWSWAVFCFHGSQSTQQGPQFVQASGSTKPRPSPACFSGWRLMNSSDFQGYLESPSQQPLHTPKVVVSSQPLSMGHFELVSSRLHSQRQFATWW